jgi:sugar phosphate isomerase/epimerase
VASIGLILHSVRRSCARDFEVTLAKVAAIGYAGVEIFSLHGRAAAEVGKWTRSLGLAVSGREAHSGIAAASRSFTAVSRMVVSAA